MSKQKINNQKLFATCDKFLDGEAFVEFVAEFFSIKRGLAVWVVDAYQRFIHGAENEISRCLVDIYIGRGNGR